MTNIVMMIDNSSDVTDRVYTLRYIAGKLGADLNDDMTNAQVADTIGDIEGIESDYHDGVDLDVEVILNGENALGLLQNIFEEFVEDITTYLHNQEEMKVYFFPPITEGGVVHSDSILIYNGDDYNNYHLTNTDGVFTVSEADIESDEDIVELDEAVIMGDEDIVQLELAFAALGDAGMQEFQDIVNAYIGIIQSIYSEQNDMPAAVQTAVSDLPGLIETFADYDATEDRTQSQQIMLRVLTSVNILVDNHESCCDIAGSRVDTLDTAFQRLIEFIGAESDDDEEDVSALGIIVEGESGSDF